MAQTGSTTASRSTSKSNGTTNGSTESGAADAVRSGASAAAETVRHTAERAAARFPDAVAGAQVAARDTQKVLEGMDDKALLIGTSFTLGLGVGLFVSGANRFLVALAMVPAGAMVMTMLGREQARTSD